MSILAFQQLVSDFGWGKVINKAFMNDFVSKHVRESDPKSEREFLAAWESLPDAVTRYLCRVYRFSWHEERFLYEGSSLLTWAAIKGKNSIVALLLKDDKDLIGNGDTVGEAAYLAAWAGNAVGLMILCSCKSRMEDFDRRTLLLGAASRGSVDCMRFLLAGGADPNEPNILWDQTWAPLHLAAYGGHAGCVEVLLEGVQGRKADRSMFSGGGGGQTALKWAQDAKALGVKGADECIALLEKETELPDGQVVIAKEAHLLAVTEANRIGEETAKRRQNPFDIRDDEDLRLPSFFGDRMPAWAPERTPVATEGLFDDGIGDRDL